MHIGVGPEAITRVFVKLKDARTPRNCELRVYGIGVISRGRHRHHLDLAVDAVYDNLARRVVEKAYDDKLEIQLGVLPSGGDAELYTGHVVALRKRFGSPSIEFEVETTSAALIDTKATAP